MGSLTTSGGTELHATYAGLNARLDLVFPSNVFARAVVPPKLNAAVWRELTRVTPLVGIGWNGIHVKPEMRGLVGVSSWTVFLVARNVSGPTGRMLGDAKGVGLFDMIQAGAAVLHGATIADVGTVLVRAIENTVGTEWDMADLTLACIDLEVGITLPSAYEVVGEDTGILQTLGITWPMTLPDGATTTLDDTAADVLPVPTIIQGDA